MPSQIYDMYDHSNINMEGDNVLPHLNEHPSQHFYHSIT